MLGFIVIVLISVTAHELGHMLMARLCGVTVTAFSIGFGKPFLRKKVGATEYRLAPIPFGGYCQMAGEKDKRSDGFLAQKYSRKLLILIGGVSVNFLLAFMAYWVHYGDIPFGILVDWLYMKSIFTKDYTILYRILIGLRPNDWLLQFSLINFFCGITNLFPIPALDGGWVWMSLLEKPLGKNYLKVLGLINYICFVLLWVLQLGLLYWLWLVK